MDTTDRDSEGSPVSAQTRRAIDMLVADSADPIEARRKSEGYVADNRCYCCGLSQIVEDDPILRCYVCEGRGHGDEALESA